MNIVVCSNCCSSDIIVEARVHIKTLDIQYNLDDPIWCPDCFASRIAKEIDTEKVILGNSIWECSLEEFVCENINTLSDQELRSIYSLEKDQEITIFGFCGNIEVIRRIE